MEPNDIKSGDPLAQAAVAAPETAAAKKKRQVDAPKIEPVVEAPVIPTEPADPTIYYEVQNAITVSWGGQMLRLQNGSVVSEASHGPGAIERMQSSGVSLKVLDKRK